MEGLQVNKRNTKKGKKVYIREGDQEKMITDSIRYQNRDCSQKGLIHVPEPLSETE